MNDDIRRTCTLGAARGTRLQWRRVQQRVAGQLRHAHHLVHRRLRDAVLLCSSLAAVLLHLLRVARVEAVLARDGAAQADEVNLGDADAARARLRETSEASAGRPIEAVRAPPCCGRRAWWIDGKMARSWPSTLTTQLPVMALLAVHDVAEAGASAVR